jgi:hypothetical protein
MVQPPPNIPFRESCFNQNVNFIPYNSLPQIGINMASMLITPLIKKIYQPAHKYLKYLVSEKLKCVGSRALMNCHHLSYVYAPLEVLGA